MEQGGMKHHANLTMYVLNEGYKHALVLVLLKYPFYPLFILDNGMNLISKSLIVLIPA